MKTERPKSTEPKIEAMQTTPRRRVVAGSVWETRMRMDEVKGGIKVFTGEETQTPNNNDDVGDNGSNGDGYRVYRRLRRNQSESVATTPTHKRRTWKPESPEGTEKGIVPLRKTRSESKGDGFGLGFEKSILRSPSNVGRVGVKRLLELEGVERGEEEVGVESIDVKEVMGTSSEEKVNSVGEVDLDENEEEKSIEQICEVPTLEIVEKEAPLVMGHPEIDPDLAKSPPIVDTEPIEIATETQYKLQSEIATEIQYKLESEIATETQYKLQSLVELVMWRDTSKTAFVFGLGTFVLLSSSYAKDLNFSLISTSSYLGLLYLAMAFIYRSILCRGAVDYGDIDQKQVLGEEEAIWAVKLVLPYLNELLIKFKSLFSGDPATTMKLALVLFVLARCGGSITVWTLVRFAFFGVFTIPKVCASYSAQLSGYGKFWVDRFRDAWDSCTHKKAVAAAIFTLIWNLSSTVARVWAVFFLAVAMRYYQQRLVEEWAEYEPPQQQTEGPHQQQQKSDDSKQGPSKAQIHTSNRFGPTLPERPRRRGVGPTLAELRKEKKGT